MEFVAIDLETTGRSHIYNSIIEVGGVHIKDGVVVREFSELIHTSRKISREINNVTGITNSMLKDARNATEVLTDFHKFIGHLPLVAHNIAFDMRFLRQKINKKIGRFLSNDTICTYHSARKHIPELKNIGYKLNNVADYYNIPNLSHHRALNDARVCADIFLCIVGQEPVATKTESTMVKKYQEIHQFLKSDNNRNNF